jgi:acyl dehydratase
VDAKKLYFEDVEIGDEIGPVERVVTDEQVNEFVRIWGAERGPSRFTDASVARKEGLAGAMVPGALNMALLSQLLTGWSPGVTVKKLDVVFRQIVLHNVPLRLKGVVTDKNVVDGEPQLECDVFIEDQQGTRLVIGRGTVVVPIKSLAR